VGTVRGTGRVARSRNESPIAAMTASQMLASNPAVPGPDDEKDAEKADEDREPAAPADLFTQKDRRPERDEKRIGLDHRRQRRERDQRQRADEADRGEHLGGVPQHHGAQQQDRRQPAMALKARDDGKDQGAGQGHEEHDLAHGERPRQELDRHVGKREGQHGQRHPRHAL
jgi:hypothetical protein